MPPCHNGPWRDYAFDAIARLVLEDDVDGIFLDGPSWFERCCYCDTCRDRFRDETGAALPPPS